MAKTHDHEIVSIYPFSDAETEQLMTHSNECVLMWATKDGWPVGVTHAFVWRDGKILITFAAHRHRAAAIRRDNRVPSGQQRGISAGIAPTRRAAPSRSKVAHSCSMTRPVRTGFIRRCRKLNPTNAAGEDFFNKLLDSPLASCSASRPRKRSCTTRRWRVATWPARSARELGARLESDRVRMSKERSGARLEAALRRT
jgi:hypothetical protein